jgi:hypothetical protein
VVASTPGPKPLHFKVELQTTDTGEVLAINALLDCGATGLFIDTEYVKRKQLTVQNLARPIPVYNVNGTLNEAGAISGIVDVVLQYKGHTEHAQFAVTSLGKQDLILGYTWLCEHNPEVDWQTNTVKMSHCLAKCHTCTKEVKAEKQEKQQEACHAQACHTGPKPSVNNNLHDIPDLTPDSDDTDCDNPVPGGGKPITPTAVDDESIKEGDQIFATCFHNEPAEVCATQNISQWLAEVFHKNLETKSF